MLTTTLKHLLKLFLPFYLRNVFKQFNCFLTGLQEYSTVYYGLQSVLKTAKEALKEVYDDYTVSGKLFLMIIIIEI